jgi:hypothetical protein
MLCRLANPSDATSPRQSTELGHVTGKNFFSGHSDKTAIVPCFLSFSPVTMIYSISARASISDGMQARFTELTVKAAEYGHVTGRISFGHPDKTAIVPHFLPFSQITKYADDVEVTLHVNWLFFRLI